MKIFRTAKYVLPIQALESFFTTWALMKAARLQPGNIFTGVFFLLSFFLYRHIHRRLSAKPFVNTVCSKRTAACISVIFTLFYMLVDYPYYIEGLTNRLFQAGIMFSVFTGLFIVFYKLLLLLFSYSSDKDSLKSLLFLSADHSFTESRLSCFLKQNKVCRAIASFYQKHPALSGFLLCVLCWTPYYLYQYPGVMTPDSINQFEQVLGIIPYSNHHPIAHTMVFNFFYELGMLLTSNMLFSVSLYTLFQMCTMAFCVSYLIGTLQRFRIRPTVLLIITLFYALVPYHAVFAVTIWKDILFAGALLLFSCSMLRLSCSESKKEQFRILFIFILSGIMLCLFRTNGWYGFLAALPFLLYFYRKKARLVFPSLGFILLIAVVIKYPVMTAAHVTQPDFIESLSIPTQQIAAVICNDRELTDEQLALIKNVIDLTYIKDLYNPTFADNMKELVRAGNQEYLLQHKSDFLKLWLELGLAYPGDYLTAYVKQTYGYWYPDSFYLVAEAEGVSATELGVSHTPLIRGPLVIKAKEISIKLGSMVPIYGLLWSMGVIFWILIFCIGNAFVRKEKHKLIYYLPSLTLYLTVMIATPVATEFRYVYFMVFSMPFYVMTALLPISSRFPSGSAT